MKPITPTDWQRMPWHPKAKIVAGLARHAENLRDEIDALERERRVLIGYIARSRIAADTIGIKDVNPEQEVELARIERDLTPDDPKAAEHWQALGFLCLSDDCNGIAKWHGVCRKCFDKERAARHELSRRVA